MNLWFLLPVLAVLTLLVFLFLWSLRPARGASGSFKNAASLESPAQRHATHCPQIRQALSQADFEYVADKVGPQIAKEVRRERRRVVILYLGALSDDFYQLLRVGRTIAKLSPEVVAVREFERLQLAAQFTLRCRMIQLRLLFGMTTLAQVGGVSDLVSHLAVRIEAALKELGERAAKVSDMPQPSTGAA